MDTRPKVELFTSSMPAGKALGAGSMVKLRIGSVEAVMTAGEWSELLAKPQRADILASEAS
jgi:hypothetical protein